MKQELNCRERLGLAWLGLAWLGLASGKHTVYKPAQECKHRANK